MSVLSTGLAKTSAAAGGYAIDNSLRFNSPDSSYLSWTAGTATNRKKWTWSGWVKRGNLTYAHIFGAIVGSNHTDGLVFEGNKLRAFLDDANSELRTTALLRDPSAWYHIVWAIDTTQGTASNRANLYINGTIVTDFTAETYPASDYTSGINNAVAQNMGKNVWSDPGNEAYLDGYLSEVHFIDGQALDHTSFGETGDYGEWKPIEVTGMTYGTNGFYLDFSNSGSLGTDASSNTNNWTVNNLAATDQMLDSPTNNFATMNPIDDSMASTFKEGNLEISTGTGDASGRTNSTFGVTTGKWYWEYYITNKSANGYIGIGESGDSGTIGNSSNDYVYRLSGNKKNNGSESSYGSSSATANILGVALDLDSGTTTITIYKDNTTMGTMYSSLNTGVAYLPNVGDIHSSSTQEGVFNFGQDSSFAGNDTTTAGPYTDSGSVGDFFYEPPTDFLALCTSNLPDPAVIPSEHFNTKLWTGTGSARSITGVGFQPDFVWTKVRSTTYSHHSFDVITGATKRLMSNSTASVATDPNSLTSFDSDGFSLGTTPEVNNSGATFVAWNWKAGGTGVSNTNGSITSTVSANADAGFSIIKWAGTGSAGTIGHGLDSTPEMVISKNLTGDHWAVYHKDIASDAETDYILLDTTAASVDDNRVWNDLAPTNTVVNLGWDLVNSSSANHIMYCFHSVDGYSKVGSYEGNSSDDGTFVYCGFRPKFILMKNVDGASEDWFIFDTERETYNIVDDYLRPNLSNAETNYSAGALDIVSNGFKLRKNNAGWNTATHIFYAIAESPFKHTNAR